MISNNLVYGNGVKLPGGAGIGVFGFVPGSRITGNTIDGNVITNNGLAGVTMHAHAPDVDLSGTTITNNLIGTNNTLGDANDHQTTGILAFSSFTPITGLMIANNTIWANYYGIWTANVFLTGNSQHNDISAVVQYFTEPASDLPPNS